MTNSQVALLERTLTKNLSPDLLTPAWRIRATNPLTACVLFLVDEFPDHGVVKATRCMCPPA
jgi:hypothetical protein